ncbi:MAG TPA: DedA family protein/thiosulfate sulfurtransferase GlpE [Steroidobacteraceae bacterium]|nr:DedA family protein/thiosulfate sulfurtransferase GlpE [Steroidobacteraceae bacterium]
MRSPIGLGVVFLNVLLQQLGLPVPVVPTLLVAGAVAASGRLSGPALYALAVAACVMADSTWYTAGRRYGGRVMSLLCRVSLSPDSCVSQTQSAFERWGAGALLFAKFVPGLALIAPPLAGATRMQLPRFIVFSTLGAGLWTGTALAAGALLRTQIERLLPQAAQVGGTAALMLLVLLAAYIAYRWWERRRFLAALDMARISVAELRRQMDEGAAPVIVDVRSPTAQTLERRRIPGAVHVPVQDAARHLSELPRDREIILYCSCPNEASAARVARLLMNHGFRQVRPLRGGLEAWIEAGHPVEAFALPAPGAAADPPPAPQPSS